MPDGVSKAMRAGPRSSPTGVSPLSMRPLSPPQAADARTTRQHRPTTFARESGTTATNLILVTRPATELALGAGRAVGDDLGRLVISRVIDDVRLPAARAVVRDGAALDADQLLTWNGLGRSQRPTQVPLCCLSRPDHQGACWRLARHVSLPLVEIRAVTLPFVSVHQMVAPMFLRR
jgi:hypothetical protein